MSEKLIKEIDGIETVEALRAALADVPGDRRVCDYGGEPIYLGFLQIDDTGEQLIVVN